MNTIPLLITLFVMTPCEKITLEARMSSNLQQVVGTARCHPVSKAQDIQLANYLQFVNEAESTGLTDVNLPWYYPDGYRPGDMQIRAGANRSHTFVTTLPGRAGTLGVSEQGIYMLGGWHPSFTNEGTLSAQRIDYAIEIPAGHAALIGDKLHRPGKKRTIQGHFTGKYLPVVFAPSLRIWKHGNIQLIRPLQMHSKQTHDWIAYGLRDIAQPQPVDQDNEILKTIDMFYDAMPEFAAPQGTISLVIGPARKSLVESFDGGALISDRAFQVLEWERLKRFHRNTLWRYLAGLHLTYSLSSREQATLLPWVSDVVGSGCRDIAYQRVYGDREWASDVLSHFAVIPEIDALIHAPQVALASTYFLAVDEATGLDVELSKFGTPHAPGKRFLEKLLDRYGAAKVSQTLLGYLRGDQDFITTISTQLSSQEELASMLQWKAKTYPRVDYRIKSITETPERTQIDIGQQGSPETRDTITVEVQTREGSVRKSRFGPGLIQFDHTMENAQIVVDPDGRLVEHLNVKGQESRFNNYRNPRWRFLLNNISGLFAVTNKDLSLAADFSLRQIYDQTYRYRFSLHYTPASVGGSAGITYAFGPELTPLRLAHAIALRGAYSYLQDEGIGLATGHLGSLRLAYSHDTRISPYFAFEGHGWNAGVAGGYHQTTEGEGVYASLGASIYGILKLPGRQGLLGRLRADGMIGQPPEQASLRLGGIYRGARGYEADSARSDSFRGLATLEHRHALFTGARIDFWGGLMWTRLEGAFFANATYLPNNNSSCSSPFFFDVGYGLRFIGDVLNISPASIVVDVGLPLNPCAKRDGHQPVTVYLSFLQSLSGF